MYLSCTYVGGSCTPSGETWVLALWVRPLEGAHKPRTAAASLDRCLGYGLPGRPPSLLVQTCKS